MAKRKKYNSGNITTSISDHLLQFIIIENGKGDNLANKTAKTTYRDYKNLDMVSFKLDLQGIDWTFATHNNDKNLDFEIFLWLFNTTLDKHAPIKELTKKRKKRKIITMGYQRNKKIYVSQRQNLQTNNNGKRSAKKIEKHKKF